MPVANGGTGLTTGTSGGVPYYSAAGVLSSSAALTQYFVLLGGGAGAAPTPVAAIGTAMHVLTSGGAGVAPTFQGPMGFAVNTADNADANVGTIPAKHTNELLDSHATHDTTAGSFTVPTGGTGLWQFNFNMYSNTEATYAAYLYNSTTAAALCNGTDGTTAIISFGNCATMVTAGDVLYLYPNTTTVDLFGANALLNAWSGYKVR